MRSVCLNLLVCSLCVMAWGGNPLWAAEHKWPLRAGALIA
jgi:hypothetical protein